MAQFVKISSIRNFNSEEIHTYEVSDKHIAICKVGNKFYAFDEICSHQYSSLAQGFLDDYTIECPSHGAQFDIRTGEALTLPAVENITTYETKIEGEDIFVKLG